MPGSAPERGAPASDFAALTRQAATEQVRESGRRDAESRQEELQRQSEQDTATERFGGALRAAARELGRLGVRWTTIATLPGDPEVRRTWFGRRRPLREDDGYPGWSLWLPAGSTEIRGMPLWISEHGTYWRRGLDASGDRWSGLQSTRNLRKPPLEGGVDPGCDQLGFPGWDITTRYDRDYSYSRRAWIELDDAADGGLAFVTRDHRSVAEDTRMPFRTALAHAVAQLAMKQGRMRQPGVSDSGRGAVSSTGESGRG